MNVKILLDLTWNINHFEQNDFFDLMVIIVLKFNPKFVLKQLIEILSTQWKIFCKSPIGIRVGIYSTPENDVEIKRYSCDEIQLRWYSDVNHEKKIEKYVDLKCI